MPNIIKYMLCSDIVSDGNWVPEFINSIPMIDEPHIMKETFVKDSEGFTTGDVSTTFTYTFHPDTSGNVLSDFEIVDDKLQTKVLLDNGQFYTIKVTSNDGINDRTAQFTITVDDTQESSVFTIKVDDTDNPSTILLKGIGVSEGTSVGTFTTVVPETESEEIYEDNVDVTGGVYYKQEGNENDIAAQDWLDFVTYFYENPHPMDYIWFVLITIALMNISIIWESIVAVGEITGVGF